MKWNGAVYVNRRTRKVHKKDRPGDACRAAQIKRGNSFTFPSLEAAADAGFIRLCERCFSKE